MMRKLARLVAALFLLGSAIWLVDGGRLLVSDAPARSDAILTLDGEDNVRVQKALELLHAGYAPVVFLDVADYQYVYGEKKTQIAQHFIDALPAADRSRVRICAVGSFSTKAEARAVRPCLESVKAHRVLITTSEAHTWRSLLTFRHESPQFEYSVAAARDPVTYGAKWWQHREWAKYYVEESVRLLWFEAVDRWR